MVQIVVQTWYILPEIHTFGTNLREIFNRVPANVWYSDPPLSVGNMFQGPQWISETTDSTEHILFFPIHTFYNKELIYK